jgi:hypothetical protein
LIYGDFSMPMIQVNGFAEIKNNSATTYPTLTLAENNGLPQIQFNRVSMPAEWTELAQPDTTASVARIRFLYGSAGNGDVDVLRLYGTGNATLYGTLTQSSDARLKKNITPMKNTLDKIRNLSGYTYNWIDSSKDNSQQIGFIAQELEKEFPQLVKTDEKGMKSVAYSNMAPVLLQAIKELQQEVEELRTQMGEMQKTVKGHN